MSYRTKSAAIPSVEIKAIHIAISPTPRMMPAIAKPVFLCLSLFNPAMPSNIAHAPSSMLLVSGINPRTPQTTDQIPSLPVR